jgi:single stranded DNA-binding protein
MINQVIVSGYIGQDPKIRGTGSQRFATFSIGHTVRWKNREGGQEERTDWFDVTASGEGLIDKVIVPYFKKGQYVTVTGRLSSRKVEDKVYVSIALQGFDLPPKAKTKERTEEQSQPPSESSKEPPPAHSFDPGDFDDPF